MNYQTAYRRRSRAHLITFDLDLVGFYVNQFIDHAHAHETLKDFAEQAALTTKIPQMKGWVITGVNDRGGVKSCQ